MILQLFALAFLASSGFAHEPEIIIPTVSPTDQKDTLQCWAVSATARFDVAAKMKLSPKYTVYSKTRAEVVDLILSRKFKKYLGSICEDCAPEPIYYEQGGVFPDAVAAAKRYGVIPYKDYPGFPKDDTALFRDLNTLIDFYAEHPAKIDEDEVRRRVETLLNRHLGGPPPRSFEFDGTLFTPKTFFAAVMPGWDHARARELIYKKRAPKTPAATSQPAFDGSDYEAFATSNHDLVLKMIKKSLKRGEPVLIQYLVVDEEKTQVNGKIGFAVNGLRPKRPGKKALEHYVLAVGARFNDDGTFSEIYVKNTWDTKPGPVWGYHWIQPDYFSLISAVELTD